MRIAVMISCVVVFGTACNDGPTPIVSTSAESESDSESRGESDSESPAEAETDSETDTETESADEDESESETSQDEPSCGDGVVDADESCDDGNSIDWDECSNACTLPLCGDGMLQVGEGCDLGAANGPGKLCNASCEPNVCGDADVGPGEGCDDGNRIDDDECPNDCVLASCGNALIDPGEECEDGNDEPGDGCTTACLFPTCGDGFAWLGHEECDDGNPLDTDECTNTCELAACGDEIVQVGEQCDDGNPLANDGCNQCVEQRVLQVSLGDHFTCALLDTGAVRCWGASNFGQLGYANTQTIGDNELPWNAGDVDLGGTAVQIEAGRAHACALLEGGTVRCWGLNNYGQLGYGHTQDIGDDEPPSAAGDVDVGGVVVQLGVGDDRTCVILDDGAVRCWGDGSDGLGYANTQTIGDNETPAGLGNVGLGGQALEISSANHSCALMSGGGVRCWGNNNYGKLGYGSYDAIGDDELPASAGDVDVGPGTVMSVAAAERKTCVIMQDGALRCWGNQDSALGYPWFPGGDIGDDETPASAGDISIEEPVVGLALGSWYTCALLDTGAVRCWGSNEGGALGCGEWDCSVDDPAESVEVELGDVAQSIDGSSYRACVVTQNGGVRCWGAGALGYGNTEIIGDDEWPSAAGYVQVFEP